MFILASIDHWMAALLMTMQLPTQRASTELVQPLLAASERSGYLEDAVQRARSRASMLAVLCVELAEATAIRERFGESAANEAVSRFAQRVRGCARRGDHLGQLRDDTLLLVAECMDTPFAARRLADRVLDVLAAPLELGQARVCAGARVGIATASGVELESGRLLRRAHQAVREAARGSRCRLAAPLASI
jgi:GGDEF domain-containing protein